MATEILTEAPEIHEPTDPRVIFYWALTEHVFRIESAGLENLYELKDHLEAGGFGIAVSNHESMLDPGTTSADMGKHIGNSVDNRAWMATARFYPDIYDDPGLLDVKISVKESDSPMQRSRDYLSKYGKHDIDLITSIANEIAKGNGHDVYIPVQQFIQDEISEHKAQAYVQEGQLLRGVAAHRNIRMFPVVQHTRMGEGLFLRANTALTDKTFRDLTGFLEQPKSVLGLSLEGTRDPGTLTKAQPGILRLFRKDTNGRSTALRNRAMFLPIGLTGTREIHQGRSWGNILHPVTITYGRPVPYEQLMTEQAISGLDPEDILMLHIAALLPRAKWGYYDQPHFVHALEHVLPPHFVVDESK